MTTEYKPLPLSLVQVQAEGKLTTKLNKSSQYDGDTSGCNDVLVLILVRF